MTIFEYLGLLIGIPLLVGFVVLFCLGSMHGWLRNNKQLFGYTEGVEEEFKQVNETCEDILKRIQNGESND